ncbi:MAG: N-acetyl-1-D-myo-inositol-2-amino-2-deoxy-alpha-D-glucopyranoside deacetylase [Mycobacteriaceae bacterium]
MTNQHSCEPRRLLLVHAHPDDESITTGGTIARYAAEGVQVTVVTCTLGEQGEVIGERWSGLVAEQADQLGGYRITELSQALKKLGAAEPIFLGGAGRWRDSGMAGTAAAQNPRAFVNAELSVVVAELVTVIRKIRPQVVISYDPGGTYGHPDHIQAHHISSLAVSAAGDQGFIGSGSAWEVPKFYWTVFEQSGLMEGLAQIAEDELPSGWRMPHKEELFCYPDAQITTTINISDFCESKLGALRAHRTQVEIAPESNFYALSNKVVQPLLPEEHFILAVGQPGLPLDGTGRETDLFAGC